MVVVTTVTVTEQCVPMKLAASVALVTKDFLAMELSVKVTLHLLG